MTASPPETGGTRGGSARRRSALGTWARRPRSAQSPMRRTASTVARMALALMFVGGVYTAFAPGAAAQDQPVLSADAQKGKALYAQNCSSCHGMNGQGVPDRGPSLIGVGSAAVEFQVTTGRMPAAGQAAEITRKQPVLTIPEAKQIGAYIQALGGGPELPTNDTIATLTTVNPAQLAQGGELFRVNCASCHTFGGGGGALSSGKAAPGLELATDREIYAAMLTGPQSMPVFGDNQLTPNEKGQIIAYIQNMKSDTSPGGWALGKIGPVTEGLVIFLVGIVGLVFATLWIAGKS